MSSAEAGFMQFTASLLEQTINHSSGNVIVSPLSIFAALTMLWMGSRGKTAEEFARGLRIDGIPNFADNFDSNFKSLFLNNQSLRLANRLYVQREAELKPDYVDRVFRLFKEKPQQVDFRNATSVVAEINRWVSEKTNGKISKFFEPDFLSPDMAMVLLNAVYFRGEWENQFYPKGTTKRDFWISRNEKRLVDTMFQIDFFRHGYLNHPRAEIVELPYKNSPNSMLVIVPEDKEGIQEFTKDWRRTLEQVAVTQLHTENVELRMPKFSFSFQTKLKMIMEQMGMLSAFSNSADFRGIFVENRRVKLSDGLHKATIEVDEVGTEVSAATGVGAVAISLPHSITVDRPFAFLIVESATRKPLFVGVVRDLK